MKTYIIIICLIVISANTHAQNTSNIREFDLETIIKLGNEIYRLDKYAASATDILFEQRLDLSKYPVRGWVVTEESGETLVTFIGEYSDGLRGVFEVRPDLNTVDRFKIVEGRELSPLEKSKFNARQTASNGITDYCSDRYNTVVIEDPTGDAWLVYLIAASIEPDLILAGGHYRITVSKDGNKIINSDKLSRSCLTLNKKDSDIPEGATPVMMFMTHIVSPTPVETHVFLSLLHNMDFAIGTEGNKIWKVSGSGIEVIEQ